MPFELKKILLDAIDSTDHTFRISSVADPAWIRALADSIDQLGLLQAPLVQKIESSREKKFHWRVVSGFRRIAACQHLGWKEVFCRIPEPEISSRRCAKLAMAENALSRPLNLVEKARAFALLGSFFPESESLSDIARLLGLAENSAMIDKLIQLTRLPAPIQTAVETGDLGLSMALALGKLTLEESGQILDLFLTFRFGLNKQRELLSLIQEIAKSESISIGRVLGANDISEILSRTDSDRPARGAALRQYLKQRRYPALTQAETEFKRLTRDLRLGTRVRLNPPPYFEGNTYQLFFAFDTLEELNGHQQQLDKMSQNPHLKRFLENKGY